MIAQTGNGVGLNQVNWGEVGFNANVGAVSGIAGYGAGKWATQHFGSAVINGFNVSSPVVSGLINGAIGGGAGGAAGGFAAGYLFSGGSVDAGLQGAWSGFKSGAAIGGALGASGGYLDAKRNNLNPWTGKNNSQKLYRVVSTSELQDIQNNEV